MNANVETQKLTVAEFHHMEFDDADTHLYELLDGDLVRKKAPSPQHQLVLGELAFSLHTYVKQQQLGEILFAPVDVFLDEYTAPQLDLVFVPQSNASIITRDGVMGIPALVVEVISPSSVYRDRVTKKELYARFGVQEYWLVDSADGFIEIVTLQEGRYQLLSAASTEEGQLTSGVLPGLTLDLNALFV
ncbi:Uma2 family endonuclease [Nibrella saemangeumensis]|uniref:Uma2 family endonuclease n=1 Tax=Nibrella saemangeumensis TaxID=1084526 RepID=A0ABP8NQ83_9BACT